MASAKDRFETPRINLQAADDDCEAIRTVPELIDFNAKHNPDQLFCVQATKATQNALHATTIAITHLQLWHAILHCSTRLSAEIAELRLSYRSDEGRFAKCQPVALFMESDVGLLIHLFAFMSLGIPVSPLLRIRSPYHTRSVYIPDDCFWQNLDSELSTHVLGRLILSNRSFSCPRA
jgi:hypothetical protein